VQRGVESPAAQQARFDRFTDWLSDRPQATALVVGHQSMFLRLLGHRFGHCEVCKYQSQHGKWGPAFVGVTGNQGIAGNGNENGQAKLHIAVESLLAQGEAAYIGLKAALEGAKHMDRCLARAERGYVGRVCCKSDIRSRMGVSAAPKISMGKQRQRTNLPSSTQR
jgi:hypothetical protein